MLLAAVHVLVHALKVAGAGHGADCANASNTDAAAIKRM